MGGSGGVGWEWPWSGSVRRKTTGGCRRVAVSDRAGRRRAAPAWVDNGWAGAGRSRGQWSADGTARGAGGLAAAVVNGLVAAVGRRAATQADGGVDGWTGVSGGGRRDRREGATGLAAGGRARRDGSQLKWPAATAGGQCDGGGDGE
ncbi:uncharacterized protein A4U43_C08F16950 [Asparagus officinalis]|nr:uncharacterized protein A4U43_C08F16950 [Asparagus officinalis]